MAIRKSNILEKVLVFKHKSIRNLSTAISDPSVQSKTATIATVFLLVILEMWETGWGVWDSHVEGAKKLIEHIHKSEHGSQDDPMSDLVGIIASISV